MQSEEEKIRYDRQVRLWGASTQQHICSTSVVATVAPEARRVGIGAPLAAPFVSSPSGLTGEVAKNLVLAGIKAIHVRDYTAPMKVGSVAKQPLVFSPNVTAEDMACNFYARTGVSSSSSSSAIEGDDACVGPSLAASLSPLGATRAVAMKGMLQDLNPFVSVGSLTSITSTPVGNTVAFEHVSLLELAAFALGDDDWARAPFPSSSSNPTPAAASSSPSTAAVVSVWGALFLGSHAVVVERTANNSHSAAAVSATDRVALRRRLLQLFSPSSAKCAALPAPARLIGVTLGLLRAALALWAAPATIAAKISRADLLLAAHGIALEEWGLALDAEVADLTATAASMAAELLEGAGYVIAPSSDEEDGAEGDELSFAGSSSELLPTVVDTSVVGGLVAQRIINAVSAPAPADGSAVTSAVVENVYSFASSGGTVEAYVSRWPTL